MSDAHEPGPGQGPGGEEPTPAAGPAPDPLDLLFSAPSERLGVEDDGEATVHVPVVLSGPTAPAPSPALAADGSPPPPAPTAPPEPGPEPASTGPATAPPDPGSLPPPPPGSAVAEPLAAPDPLDPGAPPATVGAQWGPRPHPAPVTAPPPPLPLDAPAPPSGAPAAPLGGVPPSAAGSDAGAGGQAPAAAPSSPASGPPATGGSGPSLPPADPAASGEPPSIPARPSHPRVRRWFGRGVTDADPAPAEPAAPSGPADAPAPPTPTPSEPAAPPTVAETPEAHDAGRGPAPGPLPIEPAAPPEPDLGTELVDPWGLEPAAARLSAGARRAGAVALGILTTLLVDGERVEAVVQGEYQHHAAVVALTRSRLLIVNDRRWVPDVRSVLLDDQLVVQGWQDDRVATLAFAAGGRSVVVSGIVDRPLARDLARRARELSGGPDPSAGA